MSVIKTVVKFLADRYLTKEDLLPELLAKQDVHERVAATAGFLNRDASLLARSGDAYKKILSAVEAFLLSDRRVSSFTQLCTDHIDQMASPEYHAIQLIDRVIFEHILDGNYVGDKTRGAFLESITNERISASVETNVIKRRSVVRKAILAKLPGLKGGRADLLTELVLSIK